MFVLEHNCGEAHFDTLSDAVVAMLAIDNYAAESVFVLGEFDIDYIKSVVLHGDRYENGMFELWSVND